jgi:hypothetical protein
MEHFQTFCKRKNLFFENINQSLFESHQVLKSKGPLSHISVSGSWEHCVLGPAAPFLAGIKNTKKKKR